jgi:hypothetical protein
MELIGILALGTLGSVMAFAYLSVRSVEKLKDSDAPKSSLSRDGAAQRLRARRG